MSEIEVGEYVRTNKGRIAKLEDIDIEPNKKYYFFDETIYYSYGEAIDFLEEEEIEKHIKAHSKNIIDLIEKGDYVNGMRVIATENRGRYNEEKQKDEKVILAENYDEWTENGVISNEDINTIVTKERFNNIIYKVVE